MKSIQYETFGEPEQVLGLADIHPPQYKPDPGFSLVRVTASTINPYDIATIQGNYGIKPPLPSVPGNEIAGVVEECAPGCNLVKGDRVSVLPGGISSGGAWQELVVCDNSRLVKTPGTISDSQAAACWVNYLTAIILIKDIFAIKGRGPLVMTAANSHLGRATLELCNLMGISIVAVVRSEKAAEEMISLGAKNSISTDKGGLTETLLELSRGIGFKYAMDAVGGATGSEVLSAMGRNGMFVLYGLMSGKSVSFDGRIIFTEATIRGFWLVSWLKRTAVEKRNEYIAEIRELLHEDKLNPAIDKEFKAENFKEALLHNKKQNKKGKVILRF